MLLTRLRDRLRRTTRDSEQGTVIISVIAVGSIVLMVCALLAGSAVNALTVTSISRASVQSRAAADAGIDAVWAAMVNSTFYCERTVTMPTGQMYDVDVDYFDKDGNELPCIGTSSLSGTPATGVITATGTAKDGAVGSATSGEERTIIAFLDIVINNNKATLDKVFFSDGSYIVNNSTQVIDSTGLGQANLYSNTNVDCTTTVAIQGNIYVQGNFAAHNNCAVAGTVWAGGTVTSDNELKVAGDLLSMGGTSGPPGVVSLNQSWVGGSVVANGNITGTTNNGYTCSATGYVAKVCGSVVSVEGSVSIDNATRVAGSILAHKNIDLGNTNSNLIVGGNVVSTTGNLLAKNSTGSGLRVGGYVAVYGSSQVQKANISNKASSCASSTTGLVACSPAQPDLPLVGLPSALNFPTNSRVVAPPRESLVRVESSAVALSAWTGYTIESVACANVLNRLKAGWTGKLLITVTGCTAPLNWNKTTIKAVTGKEFISLPGDLVIMNPAGWDNKNQTAFTATGVTAPTKRNLQLIVPSDAKLADGTTPLVTWTYPLPVADPDYSKPNCAAGAYGDLLFDNLELTNVQTFLYTPCEFEQKNQMFGFYGQIYSGSAKYPNNATMTFVKMDVPGATKAAATPPGPPVVATQTARFDARG